MTSDEVAATIRRLVERELEVLDAMKVLGEDGLDRLAKIALVLQRTRPPARGAAGEEEGAAGATSERLMRVAE